MPLVKIGDVTLHVEDQGRGPTLLMVHGFPLDHQMWRHQIDALSDEFRVIAPDLRGFGQSTVTPGIVTMQRYADDMAALLEAVDARGTITFCGLSMGGYVAWQFAQRHRSRLAKLILCDTKASADTPEAAKARVENAQKVLAEGPQAIIDGMLGKLFAPQTAELQPDLVKATRKIMLGTSPDAIAAALRGMSERPDSIALLKSLDLPALVICGQHDAIASVDEMRGIANNLPQAKFVEVPDAGHMAPLENPQVVNDAIRAFMRI